MKFTVAIVAVSVAAVSSFAPAATFIRVSWTCILEDEHTRSEVLHCRVRCRRMWPSKFHCCVRCRCMWPSTYNLFQNCYIQRMIVSTNYLLMDIYSMFFVDMDDPHRRYSASENLSLVRNFLLSTSRSRILLLRSMTPPEYAHRRIIIGQELVTQ